MRRNFCNIISVLCSFVWFVLLKIFHFNSFKFYPIQRFSPNVVLEIEKSARLNLGKMVRAHSGCIFKVRNKGSLIIGNNTSINYNCILVCHDFIEIGENTQFGPGVCIYDHDHDYKSGLQNQLFISSPIKIGKNCWIGANTTILRGSQIGDNCVIAANSVIKGIIPENSLVFCKQNLIIRNIDEKRSVLYGSD